MTVATIILKAAKAWSHSRGAHAGHYLPGMGWLNSATSMFKILRPRKKWPGELSFRPLSSKRLQSGTMLRKASSSNQQSLVVRHSSCTRHVTTKPSRCGPRLHMHMHTRVRYQSWHGQPDKIERPSQRPAIGMLQAQLSIGLYDIRGNVSADCHCMCWPLCRMPQFTGDKHESS